MLVTLQFWLPNEYGDMQMHLLPASKILTHILTVKNIDVTKMLSNDNNLNTLMTLGFLSIFSPQYLTRFSQ